MLLVVALLVASVHGQSREFCRRDCEDSYSSINNRKQRPDDPPVYANATIQQYTRQCDTTYNWGYSANYGRESSERPDLSQEQLEWLKKLATKFNSLIDPVDKRPTDNPNLVHAKDRRQKRQTPTRVRKEYRTATDAERMAFNNAVSSLKSSPLGSSNKYDTIVQFHHSTVAHGAHGGAAFLPWHRVYLVLYELALREVAPDVSLLYWDSTLEQSLDDPSTSNMWWAHFMGNGNGDVVSGPAAYWTATDGNRLGRATSDCPDVLTSLTDIATILSRTSYGDIACGSPSCQLAETIHGKAHGYVGGQMASIDFSPNDPLFYMHHAFIDCVWQEFRLGSQTTNPETDYPTNYGPPPNHPNAFMQPFALIGINVENIDGMSNAFRKLYKCAPRPSKTNKCGDTPYLYFDVEAKRCKPRVMDSEGCGEHCAYINVDITCANTYDVPYGVSGVYFDTYGQNYNDRRQEYYYGDFDSYYFGKPADDYKEPAYKPRYAGYVTVRQPVDNYSGYAAFSMDAYTVEGEPCRVECVTGYEGGVPRYGPCDDKSYKLYFNGRLGGIPDDQYNIPYETNADVLYYRPSDDYRPPKPAENPYFRVYCPCREMCYRPLPYRG